MTTTLSFFLSSATNRAFTARANSGATANAYLVGVEKLAPRSMEAARPLVLARRAAMMGVVANVENATRAVTAQMPEHVLARFSIVHIYNVAPSNENQSYLFALFAGYMCRSRVW